MYYEFCREIEIKPSELTWVSVKDVVDLFFNLCDEDQNEVLDQIALKKPPKELIKRAFLKLNNDERASLLKWQEVIKSINQ